MTSGASGGWSGSPEDAWLIALGAAISDGAAIDWDTIESEAADPERRQLIEDLRRLAAVVTAHRSPGDPEEPQD